MKILVSEKMLCICLLERIAILNISSFELEPVRFFKPLFTVLNVTWFT